MLYATAHGQALRLTLRLIIWERQPKSIRDIKEQEVLIAHIPEGIPFERVADFLKGWTMALEEVFSQSPERFQFVLPCDLTCPDASALIRPRDEQDFKAACLTKSRLGRWGA